MPPGSTRRMCPDTCSPSASAGKWNRPSPSPRMRRIPPASDFLGSTSTSNPEIHPISENAEKLLGIEQVQPKRFPLDGKRKGTCEIIRHALPPLVLPLEHQTSRATGVPDVPGHPRQHFG